VNATASSPEPADDGTAAVRFVVVAARRTGSNLLCTLLDSHPAILCHHEIFNPAGVFHALRLRDSGFSLGSAAERDANPSAFLERIWRQPCGHRCVGFKMTHGQAQSTLDRVLADPSVRKIILWRRNRVKTCISERVAERLDQWEVYDEAELTAARPRIRIDVRDLRDHVARNERFYRGVADALAEGGQSFLRICYEDLGSRQQHAALLRHLGVEPADFPLEARSVKQNPRDARELLDNFDELAEALRGDPLRDELLDLET
jgi:LPS sulfotransferase NodH